MSHCKVISDSLVILVLNEKCGKVKFGCDDETQSQIVSSLFRSFCYLTPARAPGPDPT
jgi:hypothetical protein